MGLINHDVITLDNRIEITNTYYSLHCCSVGLTKLNYGGTRFHADFGIWKDKDTRNLTIQDEYSPIKHHTIIIDNLTDYDLSRNLYEYAYEKLKLEITNYTDDLDDPEPEETSSTAE